MSEPYDHLSGRRRRYGETVNHADAQFLKDGEQSRQGPGWDAHRCHRPR